MRLLRIASVAVLGAAMSACALPYYWQAVGGQLDLMRRRVSIEEALVDTTLDPEIRENLAAVVELRRFAGDELGLPAEGSYRSFVDLGRNYVVWNVIAADRFSVDPVQWCFPIAGCVSYRGYFDRESALAFEQRLAEDGYDTFSGGASAYSTLGYFDDPVLSTMLSGSGTELAAVLFHELAHQRVYIKGDSLLSEGFASAVEQYGVERLLELRGDAAGLGAYRARRRRAADFAALVAAHRDRLAELYARPLSPAELLAAKAASFDGMREEYAALKASWGGAADFDGWFVGNMNNAKLAAVATYRKWLPGLRWRLAALGHEAFYTEIERLAGLDQAARDAELERWNAASIASARAQLR